MGSRFGSPTVGGRVDPTARDVDWGGVDDLEAWTTANEEA
jgi:twitching motility protein PilT